MKIINSIYLPLACFSELHWYNISPGWKAFPLRVLGLAVVFFQSVPLWDLKTATPFTFFQCQMWKGLEMLIHCVGVSCVYTRCSPTCSRKVFTNMHHLDNPTAIMWPASLRCNIRKAFIKSELNKGFFFFFFFFQFTSLNTITFNLRSVL